jgi:hypothetical protein
LLVTDVVLAVAHAIAVAAVEQVTNPICFTLDLFRVFASLPSSAPSRLISIVVSIPHPWPGFIWIAQQQHGNYVIARRSIQFISTVKNTGERFIHGEFDFFKFSLIVAHAPFAYSAAIHLMFTRPSPSMFD